MIRIYILLSAFLFSFYSQAQRIELGKQSLIALKQIDEYGFLLISKGKARQNIELQRVGLDLSLKWSKEIKLHKQSGYHFNKGHILIEGGIIHGMVLSHEQMLWFQINAETGQIIEQEEIPAIIDEGADYKLMASGSSTYLLKQGQKEFLYLSGESGIKKDSLEMSIPQGNSFGWIAQMGADIYSYSYKANKNHQLIELDLQRTNMRSSEVQEAFFELDLSFSSFSHNSMMDKELMYFSKQDGHLYAIGKLDYAFDGIYPETKTSEGFIGFWIAKFDADLKLVYFNEIPFQFFEGMISKDVIIQPAVIDLKEDLEGSLLISIHEMKALLYHNKYVITLDDKGAYQGIVGGKDEYHFFEYNRQGLRECARASKFRLMNDDWPYYATSSLHQMSVIPAYHSPIIAEMKRRSQNSALNANELIFNFYSWKNQFYLMEYREEDKGKLIIELIPH